MLNPVFVRVRDEQGSVAVHSNAVVEEFPQANVADAPANDTTLGVNELGGRSSTRTGQADAPGPCLVSEKLRGLSLTAVTTWANA